MSQQGGKMKMRIDMDDSSIIALFFSRSEQAIVEISHKYGGMCRKIAFNILNNFEDAQECVNDTYLGVWNSIPPQTPNPLITYICKITRNIALKKYHYNTTKKRNSSYDISFSELEECIPSIQQDGDLCTEEHLTKIIENFLKTLDKKSRVMFVKRYWYATSIKELAEEFGMTENYVSVKLLRIRNRLRKYLEKEGIVL